MQYNIDNYTRVHACQCVCVRVCKQKRCHRNKANNKCKLHTQSRCRVYYAKVISKQICEIKNFCKHQAAGRGMGAIAKTKARMRANLRRFAEGNASACVQINQKLKPKKKKKKHLFNFVFTLVQANMLTDFI